MSRLRDRIAHLESRARPSGPAGVGGLIPVATVRACCTASTASDATTPPTRPACLMVTAYLGSPTASPSRLVASSVEQLDECACLAEVGTLGDQAPPDARVAQEFLAIVNDHRLFARLVHADAVRRAATGSPGTGGGMTSPTVTTSAASHELGCPDTARRRMLVLASGRRLAGSNPEVRLTTTVRTGTFPQARRSASARRNRPSGRRPPPAAAACTRLACQAGRPPLTPVQSNSPHRSSAPARRPHLVPIHSRLRPIARGRNTETLALR
jgi:hypothetical protein